MSYYKEELKEQDINIEELNQAAGRLKDVTGRIYEGLDQQSELIKQRLISQSHVKFQYNINSKMNVLETGLDSNLNRMNAVQKKLAKLLQTNDTSQICTILILFGILCFLLFLIMYT